MPQMKGTSGAIWSYDKHRRLGQPGGFGDVYEGADGQGNPVAVKIIRGPGAGGHAPALLRRRELQIIDKVSGAESEYLIPILDTGSFNGNDFVVMPRADAALVSILKGPLSRDLVLSVLRDMTNGLVILHASNVLHRDLKPANVLMWKNTWRLADFGMGRDMNAGRAPAPFTFAMGGGTPHYMAPEVWLGESPTPQTDLYSLGCVAYELLTGTPPFSDVKDPVQLQYSHLRKPIRLPKASRPLTSLIDELLRKGGRDRPTSAQAVLDRLEGMTPKRLF